MLQGLQGITLQDGDPVTEQFVAVSELIAHDQIGRDLAQMGSLLV
jgi:hypothetical protein